MRAPEINKYSIIHSIYGENILDMWQLFALIVLQYKHWDSYIAKCKHCGTLELKWQVKSFITAKWEKDKLTLSQNRLENRLSLRLFWTFAAEAQIVLENWLRQRKLVTTIRNVVFKDCILSAVPSRIGNFLMEHRAGDLRDLES